MNSSPLRTAAWQRAAVCGVGLAMAGVLFGRPDVLILAAPLLLYAAWAEIVRPPRFTLTSDSAPRRIPIGSETDVTVTLDEIGLIAIARPPRPGLATAAGSSPSAAGLREANIGVQKQSWGKTGVGPITAVAADLLGAWRTTIQLDGPSLLSEPAARTVRAGSTTQSPIGTVGRHPARRLGDGSQLASIRPYQPGDRASRINWRATSRTGQLHTNQTLLERDTQIQIVMDTSFVVGPPGQADTVDLACEAVSTIAHHYAWQGDRVALVDLAGRVPALPFGTGRRHTRLILDVLGQLDRTTIAAAVPQLPRIRPGTLTFLCSPLLSPDAIGAVATMRLAGAELAVVDTLPSDLHLHHDPLSLAVRLRALQRQDALTRLRQLGIPVAPWRDPGSLVPLFGALTASRGPRRVRP